MALQVGAIGATGLGLPDLLRMRAEAGLPSVPNDTAVIFVWLAGGLSHIDTYDMKPDASDEYRGLFRPIKTNVPGIDVTELFPLHAKIADKFTLIRSMRHRFSDHGGGSKRVMTGREPKTPTGTVNDSPAIASVVAKFREGTAGAMPANILLGDAGRAKADVYALGSAYLGSGFNPFEVDGDPSNGKFKVNSISLREAQKSRMEGRWKLLEALDQVRRDIDATGSMAAMDKFNKQACELFTSPETRNAFDLSQEKEHTRRRYGMHSWGQRCLMARRLVEAGSSFVTVALENPPQTEASGKSRDGVFYNWDCHAVNCDVFVDMKYRAPSYDQALTALIEDVYDRGLDKKVLIVATGEFGHTPRLEYKDVKGRKQPGRDHWPHAFSMLVSGGGLAMGQVIGSTDTVGNYPKDRTLTPEDLWATVYRHLGIDTSTFIYDLSSRPIPILPTGKPIKELFG
ncbi:MAG: DUF1501 domain-containing protein [Planctomycetia bacterium]|jgi:hypothetical protein